MDEIEKHLNQKYDEAMIKIDKLWNNITNKVEPDYLFHYTCLDSLLSIMKDNSFYMTSSSFLNDSTEIKNIKNMVFKAVKNKKNIFKNDDNGFVDFFQEWFRQNYIEYLDKLSSYTYILSFSKNNNSTSMWYGYSKGDGYCLKIDHKKIIKGLYNKAHSVYKMDENGKYNKLQIEQLIEGHSVIYDGSKKAYFIEGFIEALSKYIYETSFKKEGELEKAYNKDLSEIFSKLYAFGCFSKNLCFENENEYRIVQYLFDENNKYEQYRSMEGCIIPFIKVDFGIEDNKLPLKEIQIGPKTKMDIADKGLKRYLINLDYPDVKISKSKVPLRY